MRLKYRNIRVSPLFYVSSSGHGFFTVLWDGGSRDYSLDFGFHGRGQALEWNGAPAYLEAAVKAGILALLKSEDARPYEYDRDGVKRYEGLRYYDEVLRQIWIGWLSADQ